MADMSVWRCLILSLVAVHAASAATQPACLEDTPILFVVRAQYLRDHHNTATLFQAGEINASKFRGGSALKVLDPGAGEVRTLLDCPEGVIRDPEVHFEGRRIVFSMRSNPADNYHLYEIRADGTGLRQLTITRAVSDIDPLYLPDDRIVFSSTREPKFCHCNRHIMANLFRMNPDGSAVQQIGRSTLFEGHATLLSDGRLLYDRWEYVDRNFGDAQGLWTAFPDGTGHAVYWGNNLRSPGGVIDARPVPGTDRVVCILGSCHDRPWGALALLDRQRGMDRREAILRTWPADAVDRFGQGNWDSFMPVRPRYEDPYPLDERHVLCARSVGDTDAMELVLVDADGAETVLHREAPGCFDPMPLASRPRPPVVPDRLRPRSPTGTFYLADVYDGTHMEGVPRGSIKYLRVIESPPKDTWTHPAWVGQGQAAPAMNWHDFLNKRILGTVPVEADGSAYFSVPADTFVYFQVLDENKMMVHSMRSGTIVRPGEQVGCAGCHEHRYATVPSRARGMPLAVQRAPSTLEGWLGGTQAFDYRRDVQPVFDRACVECHDYHLPAGEALKLSGDTDLVFNTSYNELWRKGLVSAIGAGPAEIQAAYGWGSHQSRLVRTLREGHEDVQLPPEDMERIITWIDVNAPYYATYASAYPGNLAGRSPLNRDQVKRLGTLTGVALEAQAHHEKNGGPLVSFDRPALSPVLGALQATNEVAYREALGIIQAGADALAVRPRGDMPGFVASDRARTQQARYAAYVEARQRGLETLVNGVNRDEHP